MGVDHWRSYLQPGEFVILTDYRSLANLDDQRLHTYCQQKALTKLLGLRYKIAYKKGSTNNAADSLSRLAHPSTADYEENMLAQEMLSGLTIASPQGLYTLHQGIIKYKGRIWLSHSSTLQQKVMSALHSSLIGGHSGFLVTYTRIKRYFYWNHMKRDIQQFVAACAICQQVKTERVPYLGLLQPLPIPDQAWQVVTLDFIEGLPVSSHFNCILVVVDKFSKYAHFIALAHPFTALKVAKVFMDNIYRLHGMPMALVSDRDRIFTSQLWQELFKLSGTELRMSSAYHPQSDGQTERVNQSVEAYLRCFSHAYPSQWSHWLPLAEFWYNTNVHSVLDKTPFESSVAPRSHHKLAFRYFGPYRILRKIGSVAYKLQLQDTTYVHPIFHVSLLKKAVSSVTPGMSPLPLTDVELQYLNLYWIGVSVSKEIALLIKCWSSGKVFHQNWQHGRMLITLNSRLED
ncbi:hypothetical protein U9M48_030884 [Paspalum notatum var. saurae]|uniref:Integrase catalytic domain-containing protein n=1 Tax=Paspalum notatum var. saurae TaxID=547442 RepID=A0AAQ3U2I2_PASNO